MLRFARSVRFAAILAAVAAIVLMLLPSLASAAVTPSPRPSYGVADGWRCEALQDPEPPGDECAVTSWATGEPAQPMPTPVVTVTTTTAPAAPDTREDLAGIRYVLVFGFALLLFLGGAYFVAGVFR